MTQDQTRVRVDARSVPVRITTLPVRGAQLAVRPQARLRPVAVFRDELDLLAGPAPRTSGRLSGGQVAVLAGVGTLTGVGTCGFLLGLTGVGTALLAGLAGAVAAVLTAGLVLLVVAGRGGRVHCPGCPR